MLAFPQVTYGSTYYGVPSPYTITSSYSYDAFVQDTTNEVVGQYMIGNSWYNGVSIKAFSFSSPWGDFSLYDITQYAGGSSIFAGPDVYQATAWSAKDHTVVVHSDDIWGNSFDQVFTENDTFHFLEQNIGGISSGYAINHHEDHNLVISQGPWSGSSVSTLDRSVDSLYEHTDMAGYHYDHTRTSSVAEAHNTSIAYYGPTPDVPVWMFHSMDFADGFLLKG